MAKFPTEAELAVTQAAIGDAYDGWVKDVEGDVPWDPQAVDQFPETTEAPAFSELVAASPEQMADLSARVRKATSRDVPR